MSLPALCLALGRRRNHLQSIWKLLAYCARYGHQDLTTLLQLPITRLRRFSAALNELIIEEDQYVSNRTDR